MKDLNFYFESKTQQKCFFRLPQGGAAQAAKRRRENTNEDAVVLIPAGDLEALGTVMVTIFR